MKKPTLVADEKRPGYHSLGRRIVIQFCLFTLILSAIYGLFSFVFMWMLEDAFIEKEVKIEAQYLRSHYENTGSWPKVRKSNMQLHFSRQTFPDDMRDISIEEPQRREFFGDHGRHYHLFKFASRNDVYLLAEVSDALVVRKLRPGIMIFLLISACIMTLVACLVAWFIGKRTTRPLQELAKLVDGVAPEKMPNQFAAGFPNNEIGVLARTLEQTFKRINLALEREKYFTRDVSHELRTPVAVIKNAIELRKSHSGANQHGKRGQQSRSLQDGTQIDPINNEHVILQRISEAAEQMDRTVSTLLMLAREENTLVQKEQINLMQVIERSVLDNRILLEGKDLEIDISDRCSIQINVQPGMLKVLLDNLLSNAFQYTPGGEVSIDFIDYALVVQDTGPGIDPDISQKITETGIKGKQSTGFGFGLSIVKRLCENQGWQLRVESQQGTRVSVLLRQD